MVVDMSPRVHRNNRHHHSILTTQMPNHVWVVQLEMWDYGRQYHCALCCGMVLLRDVLLGLNNILLACIVVRVGDMGGVLACCSNQGT